PLLYRRSERKCPDQYVRSSVVRPPGIRRRNISALIFHWDSTQRIILTLRVTRPIIWHLDPGKRRETVINNAEKVPRFTLVPVVRGINRHGRRQVRVVVRYSCFYPADTRVSDGPQVHNRVQFTSLLFGEVHAGNARTHFKT